MSRSGAEIHESATQSRMIQDRIAKVETHFGDLCSSIAAYGRKESRVRDKGDLVAKHILSYADHEQHNGTTQDALRQFAYQFATIQDYRHAEVQRLEDRVVGPLTNYGDTCKIAKDQLRQAYIAHEKELKQQKNASRVRSRNPSDRHQVAEAEEEAHRASAKASQSSRDLEAKIDGFEGKKLQDIKTILKDFVNIEMVFHAKALEGFAQCYQALGEIREEEDLEEFRNSLRPGNQQIHNRMQQSPSKRSLNGSYSSTMQSVDHQQRGNMSASQPNSRAGSARPTPNLPHKQNTFNGQSPQGSRSQSRQNSFSSQNQGSRVHSRQNSNAGSQQASQSTSQGNKSSQHSGNSRQSNMYREQVESDSDELTDDIDSDDLEDDYEDHYEAGRR